MCGICGCLYKNQQVDQSDYASMIDIISYRGPDDRGEFYSEDGKLGLGHRRLSIIDLSKDGHQPFYYQERYVIVFNGEIYNYIELRDTLIAKGYRFKTSTDTEVLIAMYDCYAAECVNHLNGMWAFTIYDKQNQTLFCSRDRFGVKPFYYYYCEECFFFASEIKQILAMGVKPIANRQRMLEYIVCGDLDHTNETMFKNIFQLAGGCNLICDISSCTIQVKRYYDLSKICKSKKTYNQAKEEFEKTFRDSVTLRMRADVPIGYCLSGGLDSSAITCMANDILIKEEVQCEQHSVSSCFEDKRYDEQEYIDEVVKKNNLVSHKIYPKEDKLFEVLDDIVWHMDEPFGSTSIFAQWSVFEEAKNNGLTVMLDGQGADEQLAGYSEFYSVLFAYYLKRFRFVTFCKELKAYLSLRAETEKHVSARNIVLKAAVSAYLPEQATVLLRKVVKKGMNKQKLPFSNEILNRVYGNRKIGQVQNDRKFVLNNILKGMPSLLHYEDRNSMAFSIESRVPFLDYHLVEAIFSYPFSYKIRNGITKAVMRDGLLEVLPEKIRTRYSKLGFVTLEDQWIKNQKELYRNELETAAFRLSSILDEKLIMDWFDQNHGEITRGNFVLWRIICVSHWMKVFHVEMEQ